MAAGRQHYKSEFIQAILKLRLKPGTIPRWQFRRRHMARLWLTGCEEDLERIIKKHMPDIEKALFDGLLYGESEARFDWKREGNDADKTEGNS